jgi:hypothetical protein
LEPRSRDAAMSSSMHARIYDPLWLLARQWQLGEFQGEDNGSPVIANWNGESAPLTRYASGPLESGTQFKAPKYDPRMPLETLVEREAVRPAVAQTSQPEKLRLAAESGQQFLRLLDQQPISLQLRDKYHEAFIREFSFLPEQRTNLDPDSRTYFDLVATRVPDGRRLYIAFHSTTGGEIVLPPSLGIEQTDLAEVRQAARVWLRWFETIFSEPEIDASWLPERMEYAFSVGAGFSDREQVLTAPEYYEGHLDWYAFDANSEVKLGGATDQAFTSVPRTAIPAPASYPGMPAARFWEFEDAQVNLAAADAGPTDLLRMLLIEFAVNYGNDWFVIPVELDVGCLYRTRSLIITDTFGERTLIKSSSELREPFSNWRMFQHSNLRGSKATEPEKNLFFLPPSLVKSLESRPIEEVLFLRDEMANMAWGIERVIESAAENPLQRYEQQRNEPPQKTSANELVYRLSSDVPDNWIPLAPVKRETGLRLERGKVLQVDKTWQFVEARGRILNPNGATTHRLGIFEEEIPREGIGVTRSYQLTRWHDGSTHLWVGRRKRVGRGEGSSGLRFDTTD